MRPAAAVGMAIVVSLGRLSRPGDDVVHAYHADVAGHVHAALGQPLDEPDGDQVVVGEHAGRARGDARR